MWFLMEVRRKLFDRDYTIRFLLICAVAVFILVIVWSYEFATNEVLSIDEFNDEMFFNNFEELRLNSDWGNYVNIVDMAQKKVSVLEIDRERYDISPRVFLSLPFIPYDWGKIKFAFDNGYFFVLSRLTEDYFLQPEFYDDWETVGMGFFLNPDGVCSGGVFVDPAGQRVYTKRGSTIETYMLVRSSFCTGNKQDIFFDAIYPSEGITDDGVEFFQDSNFVERYIKLDFEPNDIVLGASYPRFDADWVKKVKVKITVSNYAPRGLYMVAVSINKDVNKDVYKSGDGFPLMYLIVMVD